LISNPNRDGLAAIAADDTRRAQETPPGMPIGEGPDLGEDDWFGQPVSFSR
jgi:hypothetical protein